MKYIFFACIVVLTSCSLTNEIQTIKGTGKLNDQSIIYALPQTSVAITIEATKTIIKKGIYSEYAQKLLNISNIPAWNSENWTISDIYINTQQEADPSQYFTITYSSYPYNLDKLLSFSNNGIILDFANAWKSQPELFLAQNAANHISDPLLLKTPIIEKVDTFYKTIMTDTSFVKIPVLKKQQEAKTNEDAAKEIAKQILKIRRQKLKILRGEIENYQPDGDALKFSINELNKLEDIYLTFFIGVRKLEKKTFTVRVSPAKEQLSGSIINFSADKGLTTTTNGGKAISYQMSIENEIPSAVVPDRGKNLLYFRIPAMVKMMVKLNEEVIASQRVPVYQFGAVQAFVLKN